MVLGLLILTAIPAVTGISEAISVQKTNEQNRKDAKRMKKFYIGIYCDNESSKVNEVHGHRILLKDDRLWVGPADAVNPCKDGYVAEAFYIEYPDKERDPTEIGLVSQVKVDPPLLNWIYVDAETMELRYGNKSASIEHVVGPWDWTEDEQGIIICGEEAFFAVEDPKTHEWQIYFDNDNDGLKRYVPRSRRRLPISLERNLVDDDGLTS